MKTLDTIFTYGCLEYNAHTSMYELRLEFVSNVDLVTKIFNELVSVSRSNFKMSDFFSDDDYISNKRFASYTNIDIKCNSIDGLILKFVSRFKKAKRYDA